MKTRPRNRFQPISRSPISRCVYATTRSTAQNRPPSKSTPTSSRASPSSSTCSTGSCATPTAYADHLADYLHATGHDHPQPPHWASYDANLLIDQVSFTPRPPAPTASVSTGHR